MHSVVFVLAFWALAGLSWAWWRQHRRGWRVAQFVEPVRIQNPGPTQVTADWNARFPYDPL